MKLFSIIIKFCIGIHVNAKLSLLNVFFDSKKYSLLKCLIKFNLNMYLTILLLLRYSFRFILAYSL